MNDDPWLVEHSKMDEAFTNGDVGSATPEQMEIWLKTLCTGRIPNPAIHPREVIRGITLNHIQMARVIRELDATMHKLNAANDQTQKLVIRLTWVAVVVGSIQAVAAIISLCR